MKMRAPWQGLTEAWKKMEGVEDLIMWKKECTFFECVVEQIDSDRYTLAITTPLHGRDVINTLLAANTEIDAFDEANRLIAEFIKEGALTVSRVSPDEIRFTQICPTPDGKVFGLDEYGKMWVRSRDITNKDRYQKWMPVDMKKTETPPVIEG